MRGLASPVIVSPAGLTATSAPLKATDFVIVPATKSLAPGAGLTLLVEFNGPAKKMPDLQLYRGGSNDLEAVSSQPFSLAPGASFGANATGTFRDDDTSATTSVFSA